VRAAAGPCHGRVEAEDDVFEGGFAVELVVALVAVGVASLLQGSVGFGFGLVAVPTLTLVWPELLPATALLLLLPMTALMVARERGAVDTIGLAWLAGGRFFGTFGGLWLLVVVPRASLSALFGGLILVAVAISVAKPRFRVCGPSQLGAGLAAGVLATAAGVGGPPLALLYQQRPGPELRSTLAATFVLGTVVSLAVLGLTGQVGRQHLLAAVALLPGVLVGLWASRFTTAALEGGWLRPAVLTFAALAGGAALLRAILL
jgi:uncharacterized membrane protein YfcA